MAEVKELILELALNNQKLIQGLKDSDTALGKTSKSVKESESVLKKAQGAWLALAGAVVASTVALKSVISESVKSAKISQQLSATLKSTSYAAGLTAKEIKNMARELSDATAFEDDAIISGQNLLLTFTKIGKDVFPQATEAMLNMSQAMGQDLKSSAIQLGKALNEPVEGAAALRRVGVQLTDAQEEQIKQFMRMNDIASAQKIILGELEVEFGGSAKAAAEGVGAYDQLANTFGDVQESIGDTINRALIPLAKIANNVLKIFFNLDPSLQGAVGTIAILTPAVIGLAVAFGPIPALIGALVAAAGATAVAVKNIKSLDELRRDSFKTALDDYKAFRAEEVKTASDVNRLLKRYEEELAQARKKVQENSIYDMRGRSKAQIEEQKREQERWAVEVESIEFGITQAKTRQLRERVNKTIDASKEEAKSEKEKAEALKAQVEKYTTADQQTTDSRIANIQRLLDFEKLTTEQRKALEESLNQARLEKAKEFVDGMIAITSTLATGISSIFAQMQTNESQTLENENTKQLNALKQKYDSDLAAAGENAEEKQKIDDAYNTEKQKIEKETARKKAEVEQKNAIAKKAFSIVEIALSTAQAIMSAMTLPFPLNWIQAGLVGALGGVQAGLVAAQPIPEIPAFSKGGMINDVVDAPVRGEDGIIAVQRGESVLNRQATAILGADAIDALNAGRSGGNSVVINVNSNNGREVVEVLNDYFRQYGTSNRGQAT